MPDSSGSRRDFLRGLLGRAAREAASKVPEPLTEAAREAGRQAAGPEPAPADLVRAFAVPDDQLDIAHSLVALGVLLAISDGRFVERHGLARIGLSLGAATQSWLERTGSGEPLERVRARDAMLLETVREELRAGE